MLFFLLTYAEFLLVVKNVAAFTMYFYVWSTNVSRIGHDVFWKMRDMKINIIIIITFTIDSASLTSFEYCKLMTR